MDETLGPDEGASVVVVTGDESVDMGHPRQPHVPLRLVGGEVVQDHMDFLAVVLHPHLVHEGEELDPPAALVVLADDSSGSDIKGREQGRGAVALIVVRLADHRPPIGQLQISLRALQCLDRRLLVRRQRHRIGRWHHIRTNDVRGFGHKLRVRTLAPGLPARQVDLLRPQEPPDILLVDVPKLAGMLTRSEVTGVREDVARVSQGESAEIRTVTLPASNEFAGKDRVILCGEAWSIHALWLRTRVGDCGNSHDDD